MDTLELARMEDIGACWQIIDEGRLFQREQGFVQWTEDYPNPDTIREDVQAEKGYVLRSGGVIAGDLCVDFSGEPAYAEIDGAWSADAPYAVVHRLAFSRAARGKGLSDSVFALVEALCRERGVGYIRADTDFPNQRMQHILARNGFRRCGVIVFQGSGKLAYDKLL